MVAVSRLLQKVLFVTIALLSPCAVQAQAAPAQRAAETSDATVFAGLCFQCHNAGMWSDHRADRRGWEGVLYRMVGRGAVWSEEDIRRMANYLTSSFGPAADSPGGNPARKERP